MNILLYHLNIKSAFSGTEITRYPVLLTVDYPFTATAISHHISETHSIQTTAFGSHYPKFALAKFPYLLLLFTDFYSYFLHHIPA
ncbi:hypothetical protein CKR_3237 [Clostridium kluyveri NBRC 12016]|uniref:Uncharacterized protein n=2 Tax=Clostridium kluyveri TaxID=1534 RepID=A5N3G1_CLOK5|nr:Hypothetical protein CKL_3667 [Clostridium kluyveri DSM 555]BAH08288.1 hypothetical protein CKR_3237 [Clostridium kluyveri NBRC 12016]